MTTQLKHRDWNIVPDTARANRFKLAETQTGKVLGTFVLSEDGDPAFLNLIASAPELQDIAEMFRDHMTGNPMERTTIFSMVMQVLKRVAS